ncbi:hypothetical protein [Aggregatilinea lenta]|uniref:hypothetical protein n=1 Tax=Aggregatilinea lenta TaxID=913108 RepID=UPI0013C2BCDE|nr:hypothetical protein [Aggregatilinea lenta]
MSLPKIVPPSMQQPGETSRRKIVFPRVPSVLVVALLIVLFFRADELIGTVWLRQYYYWTSLLLTLMMPGIALIWWLRRLNSDIAWGLFCVAAFIGVVLNTNLLIPFVLVGWMCGIVMACLRADLILVGLIVLYPLIALWRKHQGRSDYALNPLVLTILVITWVVVLGIGFTPHNAEAEFPGALKAGQHRYYLHLYWGWLGDPDTLILYECNRFGLGCSAAYEAPTDTYRDKNPTLSLDEERDHLIVRIEDRTLYQQAVK